MANVKQMKWSVPSFESSKEPEKNEKMKEAEMKKHECTEEHPQTDILRYSSRIGVFTLRPMTVGVWILLYEIKSFYTGGKRTTDNRDTDYFFYLLSHGTRDLRCSVPDLTLRSLYFCRKYNMDYSYVEIELLKRMIAAFEPLKNLPRSGKKGSSNPAPMEMKDFAAMIAAVAHTSKLPLSYIIHEMELSIFFDFLVRFSKESRNNKESSCESQQEVTCHDVFNHLEQLVRDVSRRNDLHLDAF